MPTVAERFQNIEDDLASLKSRQIKTVALLRAIWQKLRNREPTSEEL